ncbi:MAG: hypothetical protein KGZ57_02925 [Dethiobacter sp.]|nr:hypothetical protein [Dethiobacter sp.]
MTPLLSNVIKARQIILTPTVYQVASCGSLSPERDGFAWASVSPVADPPASREALLAEAERKREEIVAEAFRQREAQLEAARMEIISLEEQARKTGYEAGYLEGLAEGRRDAGRLRREAEELLQEASSLRREMLGRVEPEVVRLSVAIAEQMIGKQLALAPETIVSIVTQALQDASGYGAVLVRVHPEDLALCQAFSGEMQSVLRESASLDFLGDRTLAQGDCLVETDGALLECRLGERLAELRETLTGVDGK